MYTSCVLYYQFTVVYTDMDWLTSDRMLFLIIDASGCTYGF